MSAEVETDVREIFREAGVRGWLHAVPVDAPSRRLRDREVRVGADTPVVMASVYKVVLLVAFCRAADAGDLDPREPVTVEPDRRTVGPTGLSALADPITLSWRDLATSMITVSDNAAADVILERLGPHSLRAVLDDLGLTATHIRGGTADVHRSLVADTGTDDVTAAFAALTDHDAPATVRALDPAYGSATTPSDMTRLLTALWRGETASAAQTAFARRLLRAQIWPTACGPASPPPTSPARPAPSRRSATRSVSSPSTRSTPSPWPCSPTPPAPTPPSPARTPRSPGPLAAPSPSCAARGCDPRPDGRLVRRCRPGRSVRERAGRPTR